MAGRKPKPRALRELAGNPGKRPLPETILPDDALTGDGETAQPVTVVTLEPPAWLARNKFAAEEWRRLAPMLQKLRLLHEIDGTAFANYCLLYAEWRKAADAITRRGTSYKTVTKHGTMERLRPEFRVMTECTRLMQRMLSEFGLTPSARARIGTAIASGQMKLPLSPTESETKPKDPRPYVDGPVGFLN